VRSLAAGKHTPVTSADDPATRSAPQRTTVQQSATRALSRKVEVGAVTNQSPPWPKQGPASYFPSIETKYGRSIAGWQKIVADCGLDKHMAIVNHLTSEYGMGHGHANALVGWTPAGNTAAP
jgi:hypothetical protein